MDEPRGLGLIPMVIEQSGRSERAYRRALTTARSTESTRTSTVRRAKFGGSGGLPVLSASTTPASGS